MPERTAIIIGAGPAGLTAAFELLQRTDIRPIVLESSPAIGGISQTVRHNGNRIDIGGHRFFSKSDRVVHWWLAQIPLDPGAEAAAGRDRLWSTSYSDAPKTMLIRQRVSRIYYSAKFFDYPLSLTLKTLRNLGLFRVIGIGFSYVRARLFPIRREQSLEHFFINRFGRVLYRTFFEDYTEKVWGVPCSHIQPEWGAQRIKGLSISRAIGHAVRSLFRRRVHGDIHQKDTETSLIERFLYPKHGPGQLWESVAERVQTQGGEIHLESRVTRLRCENGRVVEVVASSPDGATRTYAGDLFFSTMPICELVEGMEPAPPATVRDVARGLQYRDFITVGLLVRKLRLHNQTDIPTERDLVPDNWIYVQDPGVRVGRLQIFNNWSPFMVANREHVWIGLEYFCNVGDAIWSKPDEEMTRFGIEELASIDVLDPADVLDSTVVRMEKTYPAYFGTYDQLHQVREYCDALGNLFLLGRNGQHRYNNSDHSMLTAMIAVDNIVAGQCDKTNIWEVNTEQDYHEAKRADPVR